MRKEVKRKTTGMQVGSASLVMVFTLPQDCSAQIETADGVDYLSYAVVIDDGQNLWVEVTSKRRCRCNHCNDIFYFTLFRSTKRVDI